MTLPPPPHRPALVAPAAGTRRAEIALVAAEEFTRRGYHSTRVEHIAERLDLSPGALYRHVPGKYEMFRDAVAVLVSELGAATTAGVGPVAGEGDALGRMVESITLTTLAHRSRAALYRWQARYLGPEDRAAVVAADARVRGRLAAAVRGRRRGGAAEGAGSAAGAILSCISSLGHHRIGIADSDAVALMTAIAGDLAASVPPPHHGPSPAGPSQAGLSPAGSSQTGRLRSGALGGESLRGGAATREGAIAAAIARFHSSGYDSVTMEAIGADVGVAASALYRHFPGKSALLTAVVDRTAVLVGDLLDRHAAWPGADAEPAEVLADLLEQYVAIAFSHGPDLMLYHSELGSLSADDRRRIRRAQHGQLDRWAGLLLEAARARGGPRPDPDDARIRVHAALAVVLDGGRATNFDPSVSTRLGQLARLVLLPR
ncbi:MAG: TetR/AcrR family transcriptional regulator [Dietzia sp.]